MMAVTGDLCCKSRHEKPDQSTDSLKIYAANLDAKNLSRAQS
jgi:hypothetical protein